MDYSADAGLDRCRSYLVSQSKEERGKFSAPGPGPAVTVSYLTGAGEHEFAQRLAEILQATETQGLTKWTVFDRQLIEKVLDEHFLPKEMAKFLPEDHRSFVEEEMGELLGLHPPAWVIVPQITETVLQLAKAGHVVLVGRGAGFITARLAHVFHVRLIAPLPDRIERVQKDENLSPKAAAKFIAKKDRGRTRYSKAYFHGRAVDDLLFHLVINTARIPLAEAAQLAAEQARKCFLANSVGSQPTIERSSR